MLNRKLSLVAYIRLGDTTMSAQQQLTKIEAYCCEYNHELVKVAEIDFDRPAYGFQDAVNSMLSLDGIIAADLNRFVFRHEDRLRDLRVLIEHVMHEKRVFITVDDGVDTSTPIGQSSIMDILNQWNEVMTEAIPTRTGFESTIS